MSNWIVSREFWISAAERALKTVAQTFIAMAGASAFNVLNADWQAILGVSGGAGLISVAMSIVSAEIGKKGSPSLVGEDN